MIVGVAVKFGEHIEIRLPAPNRHCHCFAIFSDIAKSKDVLVGLNPNSDRQGFYTNTGRYLTRMQAYDHAKRCKQPLIDGPYPRRRFGLCSEDLW